ncbi:Chitin synthase, class 3 [Gonapodya sp. JEL0774]|nr:Chitin synthase, class 3 [Gonapodya sp. JEL0774]
MELVGTVVLPAAISFTLYLLISSIYVADKPIVPLILLALILGLPALLIGLTSLKIKIVGWMLVYLGSLPIWNLVLPAYAFWHFDDFTWGETRQISGEQKQHHHGERDGAFDGSMRMHRWNEWERLTREKLAIEMASELRTWMEIQVKLSDVGAHTWSQARSPPNTSTCGHVSENVWTAIPTTLRHGDSKSIPPERDYSKFVNGLDIMELDGTSPEGTPLTPPSPAAGPSFDGPMIERQNHPANYRVKYFYVLDSLCQKSLLISFRGYIELAQSDLVDLLNWCFPSDAKMAQDKVSDSRLTTIRRIFEAWRKKSIFDEELIKSLEQKLDDIDAQRFVHPAEARRISHQVSLWDLLIHTELSSTKWIKIEIGSEFAHIWATRMPLDEFDVREMLEQREIEQLDKHGYYDPSVDKFEAQFGGWKGFEDWEG